jgi:hypothetical protein
MTDASGVILEWTLELNLLMIRIFGSPTKDAGYSRIPNVEITPVPGPFPDDCSIFNSQVIAIAACVGTIS